MRVVGKYLFVPLNQILANSKYKKERKKKMGKNKLNSERKRERGKEVG